MKFKASLGEACYSGLPAPLGTEAANTHECMQFSAFWREGFFLPGPGSHKLGASSSKTCTELPEKRLRNTDCKTASVFRAVIDRTFSQFIA